MEPLILFAVIIAVAIGFRLFAGTLDRDRVKNYIREQGGQVVSQQWTPFGRGWWGEKSDRIYQIRYRDRDGDVHEAGVKTSMFSGVYLTEDRVVQRGPRREPELSPLEQENARLKQRIAELEAQQRLEQ